MKIKAGVFALFFKFGPKLLSLFAKLFKCLKLGKVGLAAGSMASYAFLFSWEFALMIMFMLFVHEYGHIWAMKREGMRTKGIYFIPFLGAAAVTDEAFPSRKSEVFVAIMGPIWGLVLSAIVAVIYFITQNPLFAAAASWMAMVNLFNLLPINPLDGGRIVKSVAFSVHSWLGLIFLVLGTIALGAMIIYFKMFLFVLLLIVGTIELLLEWRTFRSKKKLDNYIVKVNNVFIESYPDLDNGTIQKLKAENAAILSKKKDNPMKIGGILVSIFSYILVIFVLWMLMYLMQHIPGAGEAMQVFVS
jgi:Zn-dependent protease